MTLGQKIKAARLERGLTQKQVVGDHITRNMLSKIENDSATPSVRTLEYLARALGLPASYFLSGTKYSDGSSADGLDDMRKAYKQADYLHCLQLLDERPVPATTDEGYLLYARAAACLARQSYKDGQIQAAKEYADSADYYNKEGLYYSAELDAEMSLLLCECSLRLEDGEFDANAKEFLRSSGDLSFLGRYLLDKAELLLRQGKVPEAEALSRKEACQSPAHMAQHSYIQGALALERGDYTGAIPLLQAAEQAAEERPLRNAIYGKLEICYRELSDFEHAYHYAAKQLR